MSTSHDQAQDEPQDANKSSYDMAAILVQIANIADRAPATPKTLHQVTQDIMAELTPQMTQPSGQTMYVEPKYSLYSLNTGALIHIQAELQNILGPSVIITVFKHLLDNNHVLFQFKT